MFFIPDIFLNSGIPLWGTGFQFVDDPTSGTAEEAYNNYLKIYVKFLNAITRYFAFELSQKKISVNAVSPGWVRTDMGGMFAPRSIEKGAETPVWLATDAPQELTGKFFSDLKEIPW